MLNKYELTLMKIVFIVDLFYV